MTTTRFGRLLRFPLTMVRQRHRTLMRRAYQLLDDGATGTILEMVQPEIVPAIVKVPDPVD